MGLVLAMLEFCCYSISFLLGLSGLNSFTELISPLAHTFLLVFMPLMWHKSPLNANPRENIGNELDQPLAGKGHEH